MKYAHALILVFCFLLSSALAQTTVQPITNGKLTTALDANAQDILTAHSLSISGGAATTTGRLRIMPADATVSSAEGIWLGSSVKLYSPVAGQLSITGNLVVSGTITGGGAPVQLDGTNAWTGANNWAGASTFNGTTTIGTSGLAFSGSGAANTRTALGLVIGDDVQEWDDQLDELAALVNGTANSVPVWSGSGGSWLLKTPTDFRTALSLTPGTHIQAWDADLDTIAALTATTDNFVVSVGSAWASRTPAQVKTTLDLATASTPTFAGLTLSGAMSGTAATLSGALIAASLDLTTPLPTTEGGFGVNLNLQSADLLFYTTGSGLTSTGITSQGRAFVGQNSLANMRSYLELGTVYSKNATGNESAVNTEVVLGNDSRLTNPRAPTGSAVGGDIAGTYPTSLTLATLSPSPAGTWGSATQVPVFVLDAKGRVTSVTNTTATPIVGADSISLGTHTLGNYVLSVTAASANIVVTGTGESAPVTVDTAQGIQTSSTPAFAGLTLTGNLGGTTASFSGNVSLGNDVADTVALAGNTTIGGTLAVTGATTLTGALSAGAGTFSSTLGVTGVTTLAGALAVNSTITQTVASAAALSIGGNGATNPVFQVATNVASRATGLLVTGRAAGAGVDADVISSGADENLRITAKGTGTVTLSKLAVTGTSTLTGAASLGSTLAVTGTSTLTGAASLGSTLAVTGTSTLTGAVTTGAELTVTGATTPTGGIAAAGGFSVSPRLCHSGGVPSSTTTTGTDTTPVITEVYIVEVFIPANTTVTGVSVKLGTATNGNIKVGLANSAGTVVKTSVSTDVSGVTNDTYTRVAFTGGTYAATGPATYYILLLNDDTANRFRSHTYGDFGASVSTGENYITGFTTITPPTTFTVSKGPIASLY